MPDDKKHTERVAMRRILRESGTIPADANNDVANAWLERHGYLAVGGWEPSDDRVARLRRNLAWKPPKRKRKPPNK